MSVFRIQDHSPDVYVRKSRDYQLFSALFDCLNGGIKNDIDSILDILDTNQCNERLIPYLQTKLGFFTKLKIPTEKLRTILKAFPTIVRNKGSKRGIEQAVEVFLKVEKIDAIVKVLILNKTLDENYQEINTYKVLISTNKKIDNYDILKEILRYVIPAGYLVEFVYAPDPGTINTKITYMDAIRIVSADPFLSRGVRSSDDDVPDIYNNVGTTTISSNDLIRHNQKYNEFDKVTESVEKNKNKLVDTPDNKKHRRADLWN